MPESSNHSLKNFLINCLTIVTLMAATTMAKSDQLLYFILTKDNIADKKTKAVFKTKNETMAVLKGSLWYVDDKEFLEMSRCATASLHSAESKDLNLKCQLQDITKLTFLEFNLLFALTTCKERDALHSDNRRFMEVTRLYEAWKMAGDSGRDYPRIEVKDERLMSDPVSGTLKYVGEIPSKSGFWFGIEMDPQFRNQDISNTDGKFENVVYFTCAPGGGLLITANKVYAKDAGNCSSPVRDRNSQCREPSRSFTADPSPHMRISPPPEATAGARVTPKRRSEAQTNELPRPDVEIEDRVVWYDDKNDQQLATVKWIGIIRDKPDQYTIGVENDKPVGNGTGMHNNEQLFVTKPNHASLIPVVGLLKAEVVYGSRELVPPPPNASREAYVPTMTARSPVWSEGVAWGAYVNQPLPSYLHSQSDSGALPRSHNAHLGGNRFLLSASYDQIPSYRERMGNQFDRNADQRFSSSLARNEQRVLEKNTQYEFDRLRDRLVRGDRLTPEARVTCDVTDVLETGSPKDHRKRGSRGTARDGVSESNEPLDVSEGHFEQKHPTQERNQPIQDFPEPHWPSGAVTAPIASARPGPEPSGGVNPRGSDGDSFVPIPLDPSKLNTELDIGSMVEVDIPGYNEMQYGVIQWMGLLKEGSTTYAGVELENENPACTDGTFKDVRLFNCAPKKGFFTNLSRVRRDKRFAEASQFDRRSNSDAFGSMECDEVLGVYAHRIFETPEDLDHFFKMQRGMGRQRAVHPGRNMGIQGHHNSCYLDTTLFSMFAFSSAFDSILHREMAPTDIKNYSQVQCALRDGIVNPLRCQMFVRADKVLQLRQWLNQCSNIQGFMNEEKDPDEFLISLLQETMRAEPFIKFSSGHSGFCYQLFVDKDEKVKLPTTQLLLSLSLFQSDIKLVEVPRCLIIQMPRFGKEFQMYQRIVPSLTLDITNMLQHDPQPCCFCGKLASSECRDCFLEFGKGFDRAYFCKTCVTMSHSSTMRQGHSPKSLDIYPESSDFYDRPGAPEIRSEVMDLFAVICIKTSHYVTFAKCGSSSNAPWVFFDSMADRIGQQHGHNVPQIEFCPELPGFLMEENRLEIIKCTDDKNLPERMRRLLCDGYICMYQSQALEPYR